MRKIGEETAVESAERLLVPEVTEETGEEERCWRGADEDDAVV
jgi:hypothetical protein